MKTPTTPEQARQAALNLDFDVHVQDVPGMLLSLAQQVETLTKERDALRVIIVDSVAALGTSASVSQTSSIEFLKVVPGEIRNTVDALNLESKRLDLMLLNDAFLSTTTADGGFVVYQLWSQDVDENYQILFGDGFFRTPRNAIDAAMHTEITKSVAA